MSNLVCDYCHNLILQFYGYFETVNANQNELLKMMVTVQEEEVFAIPIECVLEKTEVDKEIIKAENAGGHSDDDTGWFDNDGLLDSTEIKSSEPPIKLAEIKKSSKKKEIVFSKEELLNMNYCELKNLPLNFTCSYLCPLCPDTTQRFRIRSLVRPHIIKKHLAHLNCKIRSKEAQSLVENLDAVCDICNKSLPSNKITQYHNEHKFIHYDIKPYKCELCTFSADSKNTIRRHIQRHEARIKRYGCFYCKKNFASGGIRNSHIREKHSHKMIKCDLCNEMMVDKRTAKIHFMEHQTNSLMLECERCPGGIKFPDEQVLALHKTQHERADQMKKPLACHLCERSFMSEKLYKAHLEYHVEGVLSACHICGKTVVLDTRRKMSHHAKTHMKKPEILKCGECGEEFSKRMMLARHISKIHNRREQSCYRCGKMIAAYLMKRHLNNCSFGEIRCAHCPMIFVKESARMKHTSMVHLGYKCKRCNIPFENSSQLEFHRRYDQNHGKAKRARKQNESVKI